MNNDWNTVSCCMAPTKGIHLFEFVMLIVTLSLYVVYTRMLHYSKVLHANLKIILTVISTLDIFVLLARIFDYLDISGQYDFGPTLQNAAKMICFSMGMVSLYNLLAERTFALFACQWYDRPKFSCPHIIFMVYLLQFSFVLIVYRNSQNGGIVAPQSYVSVLFLLAIFALMATLLYFLSARLRREFAHSPRFSISGQYQKRKNQRCDHIIVIYIPYQVLSFFLTSAIGGFLIFHVHHKDPRSFILGQSLLYLTMAPRVMISMLIPVIRHPALYKRFMRLIHFQRISKGDHFDNMELWTADQPKISVVHSDCAELLTFTSEQETDGDHASPLLSMK